MRAGPLELHWDATDRHGWATGLAVAGVSAAVVMAVAGLPPVDLHGPLHHLGIMDPGCGGTRAVRYAFRGQWALSWRYNPVGIPVAATGVAALLRALVGLTARRWLTVRVRWTAPLIVALVALAVALEVRQQLHADLLLARP